VARCRGAIARQKRIACPRRGAAILQRALGFAARVDRGDFVPGSQ